MSTDMIAIEVNPKTTDRIMGVAAFVWPTLTTEELTEMQVDALVECESYYFVPMFIGKFASPTMCAHPVFIRSSVLKADFVYEIADSTQPFTITRKS